MSKLDEAMEVHMASIVLTQHKPFCYRDFLHFRLNGTDYGMSHGTFRNKISRLMKKNEVEIAYRSFQTFYTLSGQKFGKPVTPYHAVVHNDPFYKLLQNLPLGKQSIHNIRLKFSVSGIWDTFSSKTRYHTNPISKDIKIPSWNIDYAIIRTIVHKTDVVSIIIACSLNPIHLDIDGIIYFSTLLTRVEERFRNILNAACSDTKCNNEAKSFPDYKKWTITMWHFGKDSLDEYSGEKFCVAVEKAENILVRVYVKEMNGKNRTRIERQECLNKKVEDIIEERLDNVTVGSV